MELQTQHDPFRGEIWSLCSNGLYLHWRSDKRLLRHIKLPDLIVVAAPHARPAALLIARDGSVFLASNVSPVIWKIHRLDFKPRSYDLRLEPDRGREVGFTKISETKIPDVLEGIDAQSGATWRIELRALKAIRRP